MNVSLPSFLSLDQNESRAFPRVLRCMLCGAPSGQVTLQWVRSEKLNKEGYICQGGHCGAQNSAAQLRALRRVLRGAPVRRTKSGHALRPTKTKEGDFRLEYRLTQRAIDRKKAQHQQQRASRRANRGGLK